MNPIEIIPLTAIPLIQPGDDLALVLGDAIARSGGLRDQDVLVCGNDKEAKRQVIELAKAAGMAAYDAGPIENAVVAEGLTAVLININVAFKIKNAGIRITGVPHL